MKKIKISIVQTKPILLKSNENSAKILNYCKAISTDIIVFPELAISGYNFNSIEELKNTSNTLDCKLFDEISEIAQTKDKIICLGFAENEKDGSYYNSAALFLPNGEQHIYRKTHLFYKESDLFKKGDSGFNVFYYKPWDINIGMMICYDWRFPESARALAMNGADLILCPSNLVTDVWHISMPSRALENNVFLATANRIGIEENKTDKLLFTGKSAIYDNRGTPLTVASIDGEEVISAEINHLLARENAFNERNDIFKDRRPEMYL